MSHVAGRKHRWSGVSLLVAATLAVTVSPALAQPVFAEPSAAAVAGPSQPDTRGREFWLAFPGNYGQATPTLSLFITGDDDTTGRVEIPGLSFATSFAVAAGRVTTVVLPPTAQLTTLDGVSSKGIHVTSELDVTVYGLNRIPYTTDAFLGLPSDILGTQYLNLGYMNSNIVNGSQFAVAASVDATTVTITPSVATGARPANVPFQVRLDAGQAYQLRNTGRAPNDLTGTVVVADKPVAVYGSHECANIPPNAYACDHIVEQLFPTASWGQDFVTMPLATRRGGDTFRVLAVEDNTQVRLDGVLIATLARGKHLERIIDGPAHIKSDKPVLVAQYSNGSTFDGQTSDPFMMLVPPSEQHLDRYTVTTPAGGFRSNFVNVVVPSDSTGDLELDGEPVPSSAFRSIGGSGYSGAQLPIALGSHRLASLTPFGVSVYGFNEFDSYGYPGGLSLSPVARVSDVAVELGVDPVGRVGTEDCLDVLVTDAEREGVAGIRVDIDVEGANPQQGLAVTNVGGIATYCYTGQQAGLDTITARVGRVSDSAEKRWEVSRGYYTRPASASFGFRKSAGYVGDPVNTATGNLVAEETDLHSAESLAGLDLTRTYNSLDTAAGALGVGWTTQLDASLDLRDPNAVVQRFADGRVVAFLRDANGRYARAEEVHGDLVVDQEGLYRMVYDDGEIHAFDAAGRLLRRSFGDGAQVSFARDDAGRVRSINGSGGAAIRFTYDATGLLTSAVTDDGRTVRYAYDDGALVAVTDPTGATTTYLLDEDRRITRVTDASGVVQSHIRYGQDGRVAEQGSPAGTSLQLSYDDATGVTQVSEVPDGALLSFAHDPQARVRSVEDTQGEVVRKTYDEAGNVTAATNRAGSTYAQTFDPKGNLLTVVEPGGATTRYSYDDASRITSVTSPAGGVSHMEYEGSERLPSKVTDPNGSTTLFDVRDGLVLRVVDADGVAQRFEYDGRRQVTSTEDGLGRTTRYDYDGMGNETRVTTPAGATLRREFDAAGRLVAETDPLGAVTRYRRDVAGRTTAVTDSTGATSRYEYDALGRLGSETDELGAVTEHTYDDRGRLASTTAPGGATTRVAYGVLSRLESTTDPVGAVTRYAYDVNGTQVSVQHALGGRTSETVDHRGLVTSRTDPLGRTTALAYDEEGRLLRETDAAGLSRSWTYDAAGNLTESIDRSGGRSLREYTPGRRLRTETDPTGRRTTHGYDAAGQLILTTSPAGHTARFAYDADGRIVREQSFGGNVTLFRYDAAGRPVEVVSPGTGSSRRSYTARGELAGEIDAAGARKAFTYDARGQLVAATAANGAQTRYAYDARGNRVARTAPDGTTERWEYDLVDRVVAAIDALGNRTVRSYDALGRLIEVHDASGRAVAHEYDAAGQLIAQVAADGARRAFRYDSSGRRTSAQDDSGTISYGYDGEGRLLTRRGVDGRALAYTYDAAGRRLSMTRPDGRKDVYGYDTDGRLATLANGAASASFTYDADGQLLHELLPGGKNRRYAYKGTLLSDYQQDTGPYQPGAQVERDEAGRRVSEMRAGSRSSWRYDEAGQLIADDRATYSYDVRGNRTSRTEKGKTTHYAYDAASRLSSVSDAAGTTTYTHDAAGRRTLTIAGKTSTKVDYDRWGQPARLTTMRDGKAARVLTLTHDVDGQLVSVDDGKSRTDVLWDEARQVPQPVSLGTGAGQVDLVHGDRRAFAVRDGKALVLDVDSSGSVLRSGAGTTLGVAEGYDAFGVPLSAGQQLGVALGYRGELTVDGLVHLRARDYDPHVGGFTTADPLDPQEGSVTGTGWYAYADNDPVNLVDPLGGSAVSDALLRTYEQGSSSRGYACKCLSPLDPGGMQKRPGLGWSRDREKQVIKLKPILEKWAGRNNILPMALAAIVHHEGGNYLDPWRRGTAQQIDALKLGAQLAGRGAASVGIAGIQTATAQRVLQEVYGEGSMSTLGLGLRLIGSDEFSIAIAAGYLRMMHIDYPTAPARALFIAYAASGRSIRTMARFGWNMQALAAAWAREAYITGSRSVFGMSAEVLNTLLAREKSWYSSTGALTRDGW